MSFYGAQVLARPSLASAWPLNDIVLPTALDILALKNGTYNGSPLLGVIPGSIAGEADGCVELKAGRSQFVSVASPNQPASVTYIVWAQNLQPGGWSDLGGIGQWNTNGALLYFTSATSFQLFINGGSVTAPTDAARLTGWHQYAVSWDSASGNGKAYCDGVLKAGPSVLAGPITYAGNFQIGQYGIASGTQNSVRFQWGQQYSAALTDADILSDYQVGSIWLPGINEKLVH